MKSHAPSYSLLNRGYEQHLLYKFTSVGANVMAFNAAKYVVEQLVRTFNRFYAVKSTAGFLFELETVSAGQIDHFRYIKIQHGSEA